MEFSSIGEDIERGAVKGLFAAMATNSFWYGQWCSFSGEKFRLLPSFTIGLPQNILSLSISMTTASLSSGLLHRSFDERGDSVLAHHKFAVYTLSGALTALMTQLPDSNALRRYELSSLSKGCAKESPMRLMVTSQGVRGLFAGLHASIARNAIANSSLFYIGPEVKRFSIETFSLNSHAATLLGSVISGITSILLTNELQKTRFFAQSNAWKRAYGIPFAPRPDTVRGVIRDTWMRHGIKGFIIGTKWRAAGLATMSLCEMVTEEFFKGREREREKE